MLVLIIRLGILKLRGLYLHIENRMLIYLNNLLKRISDEQMNGGKTNDQDNLRGTQV